MVVLCIEIYCYKFTFENYSIKILCYKLAIYLFYRKIPLCKMQQEIFLKKSVFSGCNKEFIPLNCYLQI